MEKKKGSKSSPMECVCVSSSTDRVKCQECKKFKGCGTCMRMCYTCKKCLCEACFSKTDILKCDKCHAVMCIHFLNEGEKFTRFVCRGYGEIPDCFGSYLSTGKENK